MPKYGNPHPPGCFWHQSTQEIGPSSIKWCEQSLCGPISEPANAWSSLSLVFAALLLLFIWRKHLVTSVKAFLYFGLTAGLMSFTHHASNNLLTQTLDYGAMYAVFAWYTGVNLKNARATHSSTFKLVFTLLLVIGITGSLLAHAWEFRAQWVGFSIALAAIFSEVLSRRKRPSTWFWFVCGALLLILGSIASMLDLLRVVCDPTEHLLQGHTLWHFLAALSLACFGKHLLMKEEQAPSILA